MSDAPRELQNDDGLPILFGVPDPFLIRLSVQPGEVDAQGHVNNAVYVQWMDKAAFAHSAAVGYDWKVYQNLGSSFVVRRHEIDYLAPGFEGDRIVVATWPTRMEKFTALRRHQIVRESDGKVLVKALTTWVYLDTKTGRPQRMPADLVTAFRPRADAD
ncbi:MAG: thioesterase family protein [Planctomycetota bacterium]|nr:thioesterase family protein [Planctomycetota bacterium]